MKIKLDKNGWLYYERDPKKVMQGQYCPYSSHEVQARCGAWCPLFQYFYRSADAIVDFDNVEVLLCGRILNIPVSDFTDER